MSAQPRPQASSPERLAAARVYLAAGFSIIRLDRESKLPAGKWKESQKARPSAMQLRSWFAAGSGNIGIVMGQVSDNAFALDFDDPRLARFAFDLEELAQKTFVQKTPRGVHAIFRAEGGLIRTTSYHARGLPLDVKGEGGYIVAAPSRLSIRAGYTMLSPDVRVATIEKEWLDALITRLRARWPIVEAVLPHYGPGRRSDVARCLAAWLRLQGFSRDRAGDFMRALGRVVDDPRGPDRARAAEDVFEEPATEVLGLLEEDVVAALQGALRSMKRRERVPALTLQAHFDHDGAARPPEGF